MKLQIIFILFLPSLVLLSINYLAKNMDNCAIFLYFCIMDSIAAAMNGADPPSRAEAFTFLPLSRERCMEASPMNCFLT
jgi:hypothetical protein